MPAKANNTTQVVIRRIKAESMLTAAVARVNSLAPAGNRIVKRGNFFRLHLTFSFAARYIRYMAQSYLIFDFGSNEDLTQQARHRLDSWRQAFHLTNKLEYKLDREGAKKEGAHDHLKLVVRLDFSDHEKLSHQRWVDRIPSESPFKDFSPKVVRQGDPEFADSVKLFDSLNHGQRAADRAARER